MADLMMDSLEATQPATQIVDESWFLGNPDPDRGIEDLADVCCILHPSSGPARKASHLIHQLTPEYTIASTKTNWMLGLKNNTMKYSGGDKSTYDIALRLSRQRFPSTGAFYFGRNPKLCDVVIGKDESKQISNIHFRIYINRYGYLMLEDLSTNGTAVDGDLLRATAKATGLEHQHVLVHGSVVTLAMDLQDGEEDYSFIVRIPPRDSDAEEEYKKKLTSYFNRIETASIKNAQKIPNGNNKNYPCDFLAIEDLDSTKNMISKNLGRESKEWKGGSKYNKISRIGKGAFATVYLVTSKYGGVPYAAKELEKRRLIKDCVDGRKLDAEMKIMQKIKHPNIVQFVEHIDWEAYLYIIMEYVPGGDLGNYVCQYGLLSEIDVKIVAGQLLSALKHLHGRGITHRDIKPDNILISCYQPIQVKLTDFGLSKMIDSEETFLRTFCGTLLYCAPEVYLEYREFNEYGRRVIRGSKNESLPPQRYGNAVDIWSLAGVLFYLFCGNPPFPVQNHENYLDLLTRIMSQPLDVRPLQLVGISDQGIRFVGRMLNNRPAHRATIEELEKNQWLAFDKHQGIFSESEADLSKSLNHIPCLEKRTSQLNIQEYKDKESKDNLLVRKSYSYKSQNHNMESPHRFEISESLSRLLDFYDFPQPTMNVYNESLLFVRKNDPIGSSALLRIDPLDIPPTPLELPRKLSEDSVCLSVSPEPDTHKQEQGIPKICPLLLPFDFSKLKEICGHDKGGVSDQLSTGSIIESFGVSSSSCMNMDESHVGEKQDIAATNMSLRRPREDEQFIIPFDPKRRRVAAKPNRLSESSKRLWNNECRARKSYQNTSSLKYKSEFNQFGKCSFNLDEVCHSDDKNFGSCFEMTESFDFGLIDFQPENPESNGNEDLISQPEGNLSDNTSAQDKTALSTINHKIKYTEQKSMSNETTSQNISSKISRPSEDVLAELVASADSCLPDLKVYLIDCITSWGRGFNTTIRCPNLMERRIPKYAFKIFLYEPDYYNRMIDLSYRLTSLRDSDQNIKFYISTKASVGIWVNEVHLPSYNRQNPRAESKYWGQLKHGDLITVWRHDLKPREVFTRFHFKCYWGQSRQARKPDEPFTVIEDDNFVKKLELDCRKVEDFVLAETGHD